MGDIQCSVLSTFHRPEEAVLNISTSAQLVFVMRDGFEPRMQNETELPNGTMSSVGHVEYFPYFNGRYLAVAAALTGGNSLAAFVRMLQQWAIELGANLPQCNIIFHSINQHHVQYYEILIGKLFIFAAKIWERILIAGADESSRSSLKISPNIFGERHAPGQNASVSNIDLGNISLGQVTRAICKGIIENLHE